MTAIRWGHGLAQLVKPSTKEETEIVVFLSDQHFPYQEDGLISSSLSLIKRVKPHRVVLNGDVNDYFQLSRFNKGAERMDDLQSELDEGNKFRYNVRKAAPNAVLDENEGNHDHRITKYVAENARALVTLRALEPAKLFLWDDLAIVPHPGAGFRLRPDFLVKHGTIVRAEAGATAKAEFTAAGISGISGHTHRLATYRKGGYLQRQWTEQGTMSRLDADYVVGAPNWTQGIVIGEFSTKTPSFVTHEVPFVDGKLHWGQKKF